jgi:hypothetical protein
VNVKRPVDVFDVDMDGVAADVKPSGHFFFAEALHQQVK